jgi:hypothetical protein
LTRRRRPTDEEILAAIVELADDGFCERRALLMRLPGFGERELIKSLARAARRNLVLERHARGGQVHLALSSEGWRVHRDE